MCHDHQCIIKTLIAKAYVTEIKTFLNDADYIRSRCPGCIRDHKDTDYHKLCNSSSSEYKLRYCVKDLFEKINLFNVVNSFRSLVDEVGVDFIRDKAIAEMGQELDAVLDTNNTEELEKTANQWVALMMKAFSED